MNLDPQRLQVSPPAAGRVDDAEAVHDADDAGFLFVYPPALSSLRPSCLLDGFEYEESASSASSGPLASLARRTLSGRPRASRGSRSTVRPTCSRVVVDLTSHWDSRVASLGHLSGKSPLCAKLSSCSSSWAEPVQSFLSSSSMNSASAVATGSDSRASPASPFRLARYAQGACPAAGVQFRQSCGEVVHPQVRDIRVTPRVAQHRDEVVEHKPQHRRQHRRDTGFHLRFGQVGLRSGHFDAQGAFQQVQTFPGMEMPLRITAALNFFTTTSSSVYSVPVHLPRAGDRAAPISPTTTRGCGTRCPRERPTGSRRSSPSGRRWLGAWPRRRWTGRSRGPGCGWRWTSPPLAGP